jgi:hypothetical protein
LKTRILLAGLAAVVAMAFSASSAFAVTASPTGPFTFSSSMVNFKVDGLGFTCTSSKLPGVVASNGAVYGLTPSFSSCKSAFGPTTVTDTVLKTPFRFEMAFDSNGLNTSVQTFDLAFSTAAEGCRFDVTGYEPTTSLGTSPLRLSELVFPNGSTSPATLTLSSFPTGETSHCFNLMTLNSPVSFQATYKLNSPLTITK